VTECYQAQDGTGSIQLLATDDDDDHHHHHHHHHHHYPTVRELGNLLGRFGLIDPGVYSKVLSGSLNHVACNFV
jgi:hypothetical protein